MITLTLKGFRGFKRFSGFRGFRGDDPLQPLKPFKPMILYKIKKAGDIISPAWKNLAPGTIWNCKNRLGLQD